MEDAELFINVKGQLNLGLDAELGMLTKYQEPLLSARCRLYKDLLKKREQYRHPKDKEYTDFDRRTMMEAQVAELQEQYEVAKGLEELVKERVQILCRFNLQTS